MLLSKVVFAVGAVLLSGVSAAPFETLTDDRFSPRELTNAERISRGLGLNKPNRLYNASRVNSAAHVKRSSLPEGVPTGSLAFTTVTGNGVITKREETTHYAAVDDEGQLRLTEDPQYASIFGLPRPAAGADLSGAYWIPQVTSGRFIAQQAYILFASLIQNNIFGLNFDTVAPTGSQSNIVGPATYAGALAMYLALGGASPSPLVWVMTPDGGIAIAPSIQHAQVYYPGSRLLLPTIFQPGSIPDFTRALASANNVQTNEKKIWATSWTMDINGYVAVNPNGGLSIAEASPFWLPGILSGASTARIYSERNGQIITMTSTDGDNEPFTSSIGTTIDNLRVNYNSYYKVILDLVVHGQEGRLILLKDSTLELSSATGQGFGDSKGSQRVCMELIGDGEVPGQCEKFINEINDITYGTRPVNVYASTAGGIKGYLDTNADGSYKIGEKGGKFYEDNHSQVLWSKIGVNYLTMSADYIQNNQGLGPFFGALSRIEMPPTAFLGLPDPSGGIIKPPPNIYRDYSVNLTFYIEPATSAIYAFNGHQVAMEFSSTLEELCLEMFNDQGQPGWCESQKWSKIRNGVQLYATQTFNSATFVQGWVTPHRGGMGIIQNQANASTWFFSSPSGTSNSLRVVDTDGIYKTLIVLPGQRSGSNYSFGQPMLAETVSSPFQANWIGTTSLDGGLVTPLGNWLWNYIPGQEIFVHPTLEDAKSQNPTFVNVCIEAVKIGGQPKGVCGG